MFKVKMIMGMLKEKEKCNINEDGIQIITKENDNFKTIAIDFLGSKDIVELYNNFMNDHKILQDRLLPNGPKKSSENDIGIFNKEVDVLYSNFIKRVFKIDPEYGILFSYVSDISSSYLEYRFYSPEHLKECGPQNHYEIVRIEALENFLAYMSYITRKKLRKMNNVYAYSHRFKGFNTQEYKISDDFKIEIKTNFGYGNSSYFDLVLFYKDHPIIPYTNIVYYKYINAQSLIHNTQDYPVRDRSWKDCFEYTVKIINDFYAGSQNFIKNYVVETIEEMFKTLDFILKTNLVYHIPLHKMNSILNFKQRHIIYEYDKLYMYSNDNLNGINVNELSRLLLENTLDGEFKTPPKKNMYKILPESYDKFNSFDKDRFVYALTAYLDKQFDSNESYKIESDVYYNLNNVKRVLYYIVNDSDTNIGKYVGYDLYEFRASRIAAIARHAKTIDDLSDIIDSRKYIDKIRKIANENIPKIEKFIENLSQDIIYASQVVDEVENEFIRISDLYEADTTVIKYKGFIKVYNAIENLISSSVSSIDKINWMIVIEEDKWKRLLFDLFFSINSIDDIFGLSKNQFFELSEINNGQIKEIAKDYEIYSDVFNQYDKIINEIKDYKVSDIDLSWLKIKEIITGKIIALDQIVLSNKSLKQETNISLLRKYISYHKKANKFFPELYKVNNELYDDVYKIERKLSEKKNILKKLVIEKDELSSYIVQIKSIL